MNEQPKRVQRKLTAILAEDIVGYSRLMEADEAGTLARIKTLRAEFLHPKVAAYGGRIVKTTGDGTLIEFPSAVDAVQHAIEVQREMARRNTDEPEARRIALRMGINVGDIIIDGDDIYGDGVNVAARLEALAEPGGICISGTVYEHVRNKLDAAFDDLGAQTLKNIAKPVQVYRVSLDRPHRTVEPALALPNRPSIAVLPFDNLSGDPEQAYFADGVVEDIITALSRIGWLFVIARNSSFTYKGKAVDVKQVGRELGVRYVLEGSVRKAASRVRITGQLIDATTGGHVWADRFEGAIEDIFELQDRITASVVGAIEPALRSAEMRRALTKPTASLDAYDFFLRALAALHPLTRPGMDQTIALCRKAIAADSRYGAAYGLAGWCCGWRRTQGWSEDREGDRTEGVEFARLAIEFGADDPGALWMAGHALSMLTDNDARAIDLIERSLALNPNSAQAWNVNGWVHWHSGEGDTAIEYFQRAMRLSPLDPLSFTFWAGTAWAHFVEGRYDEASRWADRTLREQPRYAAAHRVKIAAYGMLGRAAEAREAVRAALALDPEATITNWMRVMPIRRPENRSSFAEGLRKAGLPE